MRTVQGVPARRRWGCCIIVEKYDIPGVGIGFGVQMKYYTAAQAPKPELLSSFRAAAKLAPLKQLLLLFLHFTKKFYGFSAKLPYNISQHSKCLLSLACNLEIHL